MKKIFNIFMTGALLLSAALLGTACSDDDDNGIGYDPNKYPAPVITDFSPSEAYPSDIVTIKGSNFGSERSERIGRVYFGGVEATEYAGWSDTEIKVRVPANGKTGNLTLWVWRNYTETAKEFTCVPGAEVIGMAPNPVFPGSVIVLTVKNLHSFISKGLKASDITVTFHAEKGTVDTKAAELTETTISVKVPYEAKGGELKIDLGGFQQISTPSLDLIGDYHFSFLDYIESGGTIKVADGCIDSTKDGAYVIFKFNAPTTGLFDAYTQAATKNDGSSLNINIGKDLNLLKVADINDELTRPVVNLGTWNDDTKATYGPFYLEEGVTYYLKVSFLTTHSSWCANLHELGLNLSADQNQTPVN